MARISNKQVYKTVEPTASDYVVGTDAEDLNKTKTFTMQGIADFVGGNVTVGVGSLNGLVGAVTISAGVGLVLTEDGNDLTLSLSTPDFVESINGLDGVITVQGSTNIGVTDDGTDTITLTALNLAKTNESNTFTNDQTLNRSLSVAGGVFDVDFDTQRVGVNNSTPLYPLDIVGDTSITGTTGDVLTLNSPSEVGENYILFNNSLGTDKGWVGYRGASDVLQLRSLLGSVNIIADTSVTLSYGGVTRIETTGSGVQITGDLTVGDVTASSIVITGGTSSDFLKADGSLDSTAYQDITEKGQADGYVPLNSLSKIENTFLPNDLERTTNKGAANGYAPLDSGAKIPLANIPDSVLGQVTYEGTWDVNNNLPLLTNPPAADTKGEYYVCSSSGTQFGITFQTGDWIISNGTAWEKVDNTDAVTSVFGRLGNIIALESDYDSFYPLLGTTISAGSGLTGGGDLSANRTISHGDTSTQASVDNSGGSVIQDVTLDGFGHVTGLVSVDLDGRYVQALTDTLDSVTSRGNTTTNGITIGDLNVDGGKITIDTSAIVGREDILLSTVSDNTDDKFGIANGTTVSSRFIPTFYGYTNGSYQSMIFRGLGDSVYDGSGSPTMVEFLVANTNSTSDPNNGTLTAITQRPVFNFGTTGNSYLKILASGYIGLGNNTSPTEMLDVNGNVKATSFIGSGASLTSLNASNISSGVLNDSRLSSNVALLDNAQTINGFKTFNNIQIGTSAGLRLLHQVGQNVPADNTTAIVGIQEDLSIIVGLGSSNFKTFNFSTSLLTNNVPRSLNIPDASGTLALTTDLNTLNASNITTGTLADARLSSNVALKDVDNNFSVGQTITGDTTINGFLTVREEGYQISIIDDSSGNVSEILSSNNAMGFFADRSNTIADSFMLFSIDGTERMRIDSSGNVLVGTSTFVGNGSSGISAGNSISLGGSNPWSWFVGNSDNGSYVQYIQSIGTATHELVAFIAGNPSSSMVGSITSNGSSTSYNTSSDYRLKENVVPMTGALDRVDALKPARFNFIADADKTVDGFLAHEVQDIVPEAVTGIKDAMREEEYEVEPAVLDDDGNVITEAVMGTRSVPDYQGIDQSKLVPLLVGAIQEQQSIINDLITRIENLEK